jgi:type IX secretion system PorP/SprF family membrane protein
MYHLKNMTNLRGLGVACIFILFKFLFVNNVQAQDIHYSQFYNPVFTLNPGKTGIFSGDKRFLLSYRNQWSSVPVPWRTFTGSYDQKFYPKRSDKYFFSGGLNFNYDRQGDSQITLSNINLAASYTKVLNTNNLFTLGLSIGYANRGFDFANLRWDSQWNGNAFDEALPSGELFDAERINYFENAVGLNYRWQKDRRTKFDIGASIFHFIEPQVAFFEDDDISLPKRFNLSAILSKQLSSRFDIQLQALGQLQNEYTELLGSGLIKIYINTKRGKEAALHLGIGYRTSGSVFAPIVALELKDKYYFSFNYERDVSDFTVATGGNGGFEAHFRYTITNVKAPAKFKTCPIY